MSMRDQAATVLAPMGLRLSEEKTKITHIDDGVDFLGWRIQRHRKRGTNRSYIYWYPSRKAVKAITGKVKMLCRRMDTNEPLDALLRQLNAALRGWCTYFRPGMSARTFCYLSSYLWGRVIAWLRRKHRRITWKELRRQVVAIRPGTGDVQPRQGAHHALQVSGRDRHPPALANRAMKRPRTRDGACGEPAASTRRTAGSGGGSGRRTGRKAGTAPRVDLTALTVGLTTPWPRHGFWHPRPMNGCWKVTSRRASTRSRIRP